MVIRWTSRAVNVLPSIRRQIVPRRDVRRRPLAVCLPMTCTRPVIVVPLAMLAPDAPQHAAIDGEGETGTSLILGEQ